MIRSVSTLLVGMAILLAGSGLLGTALGLRAAFENFDEARTGIIMAGYFVGFAFSPKVWAGVILGGVGLVLMATASALKRRGIGVPGRPRAESSRGGPKAGKPLPPTAKSDDIEDMDDIDAILRKHGIQ